MYIHSNYFLYDPYKYYTAKSSMMMILLSMTMQCTNLNYLSQCFSTGVPRNPRVPRASAKGSAAGQ